MKHSRLPGTLTGPTGRYIWWAVVLVFFAALFAYRVTLFSDIEPRSDQAFFSWWVQGLATADHALPSVAPDEGFLTALVRDDHSFLHRLLRPIYAKSLVIFTLVPLVLRSIAAWIFGTGLGVQTVSSIFASTLIVVAIGVFPVWAYRKSSPGVPNREVALTALITTIFAASSFYLHFFSPLGNHNFGVLFLVIAAGATQHAINSLETKQGGNRRVILYAIALQALALYAHWTNVFLVPAATILAWLFSRVPIRRKITVLSLYLAALGLIALPFLLFAGLEFSRPDYGHNHTFWILLKIAFSQGEMNPFLMIGTRAIQWFENGALLFSAIGVILGIVGTIMLGVRQRIFFPLSLCLTHFLVSVLIAIFIGTYSRTALYILPFLALGTGYTVYLCIFSLRDFFRSRRKAPQNVMAAVIIVLAAYHLWQQDSLISSTDQLQQRIPDFWASYFKGQGEVRPVAEEIDAILPERAVILTWGYGTQFLLRNYSIDRPGRKIIPPLLTLMPRFNNGTLVDLIKRRNLSFPAGVPVYSLIDHTIDQADRETLRQGIEHILGPAGFALATSVKLESRLRTHLNSSWPRDIDLYRIHMY